MKNLTTLHEGAARLQASRTIQHIHKKIEQHFPKMENAARSRLIIECLIEIEEEKKYRKMLGD